MEQLRHARRSRLWDGADRNVGVIANVDDAGLRLLTSEA
jgi:hypothetical protein